MPVELVIHPNPRQRCFFLARERYVAYGGARGGGKSWAVRMKAALLALCYPGIRLLIVRRTLPELEDNHIRPLRQLLSGAAEYREKDRSFLFPNGSALRFGYCDAESDVLRYQGQEYDCVFLDEATQLTEYQFQTFKGCLRGVNDFPKRLYLTCNPGGVGHAWVKRLFIERSYREGERAEEYRFIPAQVYDNTALMEADRAYVERLESLPHELREAWLHGSWDVFAGQFFPEWDRAVHVCEPFEVSGSWRRYVTIDYGMDMLRSDAESQADIKRADRNRGFERLYELLDCLALEFYDEDRMIYLGADEEQGREKVSFVFNADRCARTVGSGEERWRYFPRVDVSITAVDSVLQGKQATLETLERLSGSSVTAENWKLFAAQLDLLNLPGRQEIIEDWSRRFAEAAPPAEAAERGETEEIHDI